VSAASILSCSPVIYSNVGHNTPMFTEKGEFAINGFYAEAWATEGITETKGFSLQAAYAIDDHWAAMGSLYSLKKVEEADDTYNWEGNGTYWELGGGRYGKLGLDWLAYEVFGGVWILICLILAIVQIGILPVALGSIIYIWGTAATSTALIFTIWMIFVGLMDNFLKPIMLGKGAPAPMAVVFIGAIGGFIFSGFIGLFTGAIILSLGYNLVMGWIYNRTPEG
jgi:hypothetical protein